MFWKKGTEDFYCKKSVDGKVVYRFQEKKILEYIQKHATHSEFIFITIVGKSQNGKSHLAQTLSGVKHEIGDMLSSQTQGATIAYAGTIREIYLRLNLTPPNNAFCDRDVFISDTEGLFDETEKGPIASLIMPLLVLSSNIVAILRTNPDSSFTNFLSICKSFIKISDEESQDPFQSKLLVRFIDYPPRIREDVYYEIEKATRNILEKSQTVRCFNEQSIHPIYVPGGPWDCNKKCHVPEFTKNFLDKLFSNQDNLIVYSSPQKFVSDVKQITNSPLADYARINEMFKEKNSAERLLGYICIQIERESNNYFMNCLERMDFNKDDYQDFFQEKVVMQLTNGAIQNNINQTYFDKYIKLEEKKLNNKVSEIKIRISKFKKYKFKLNNAKSQKSKFVESLKYLSDTVADSAQNASETIFRNVNNNFTKIETYQDIIIRSINGQKRFCIRQLLESPINIPEIVDYIRNDINAIFQKLLEFKEFTFYRQHGVISKILKFIFDSDEFKAEADEILPKVWALVNSSTDKYFAILFDPRGYLNEFSDLINSHVEDKIMASLNDEQKAAITSYIQENDTKYVADLSEEQIENLVKNHARSIFQDHLCDYYY